MAIMKCRECGNRVSSEAAICPHCGVSNPAKPVAKAATSPTEKRGMSGWKKIGIVLLVLWVIGFISQMSMKRTAVSNTAVTSPSSSQSSGSSGNQDTGAQCFNKGDAIATVYLANIKQAVDVGMLASDMMNRGCQDSAAAQGQSCVDECKSGFKAKAKQWVKDGSLN
jgi:hypothetical protein